MAFTREPDVVSRFFAMGCFIRGTTFVATTLIEFDSPGDVTDVEAIRSLSLSALDETTGEWGIAMLRLLANLDPTQADDVTVLLFGDVEKPRGAKR